MIDSERLKTFDDVKQYSLAALWETYKALKPNTMLSGFSDRKHAAAHLLPLTRGDVRTLNAACEAHGETDDILEELSKQDDRYEIYTPMVRLGHQDGGNAEEASMLDDVNDLDDGDGLFDDETELDVAGDDSEPDAQPTVDDQQVAIDDDDDEAAEEAETREVLDATRKRKRARSGLTYQQALKLYFDEHGGVATRSELVAAIGCDARNLSTAISILQNPRRCKTPMKVAYEKATQTYRVIGSIVVDPSAEVSRAVTGEEV